MSALAGKQWIAGGLSLADFALATTFQLRRPGGLEVEAYPNVTAWIERLEARPSWAKAIAPMLRVARRRGASISANVAGKAMAIREAKCCCFYT